VLGVEQTKLKG